MHFFLRKKYNFQYQTKRVENKTKGSILFFPDLALDILLDYVQGSLKIRKVIQRIHVPLFNFSICLVVVILSDF